MKNFVVVLLALLFVACTSSPSQPSRGPASDDQDPRYSKLPIAQKIEMSQALWFSGVDEIGASCIPGWKEKYARELPRYMDELKNIATKNESALNQALANVDRIKVASQVNDRCNLTNDSFLKTKEKLAAINSALDAVKKASDSLTDLQSRGIKRFYNQIGKEYKYSPDCWRQKKYDDAVHMAFLTSRPLSESDRPFNSGFVIAEQTIITAAQSISDMQQDVYHPCSPGEFSCSCQRANKVEDLGIIELQPGENPLYLEQKAKEAIVDGCENDKLICRPYKSEPKDSSTNSKGRDVVQ